MYEVIPVLMHTSKECFSLHSGNEEIKKPSKKPLFQDFLTAMCAENGLWQNEFFVAAHLLFYDRPS